MDRTAAKTPSLRTLALKKRITRYRSTSDLLYQLACHDDKVITIGNLSSNLGERGFGIIILLFALPNAIPLPIPGISTLTSIPLIFFSAQICLGREVIWLPRWLAQKQLPMNYLRPCLHKSLSWLKKLERIIKPRYDRLTTRSFERFAGVLMLILAILIALPIPLGNLPLGIAMAVLALAITERDGVAMITGWLFTIFALCYFVALISGYAWVIWQLVSGLF
jgi:hypothetical protein